MVPKLWRIAYHNGMRAGELDGVQDERTACRYAASESGVLRCVVSVWYGADDLVAAYDSGVERDLTADEFQQALSQVRPTWNR